MYMFVCMYVCTVQYGYISVTLDLVDYQSIYFLSDDIN